MVYPIDKALSKYGLTNFKFEILTEITADSYDAYKHSIDELERFYINKYRNDGFVLYNITDGGGYSWLDYNATREYKPLSDLQKEKISKSLRKYYKTHKRKKFFGGKNPNAKRIVGIKDGIVVCKYECGKDLCTLLDMNYSTFKKRVQNKTLIVNNVLYIYETDIKKNI